MNGMRAMTLALGVLLTTASGARADDYPSRPVTFVVPFAPGGVTSLFARLLSQKLEQKLGKPFIVENRPGGGGVTAATGVAHGTADGYTIMMASSTVLAINVTLRKNLPYDPRKDLTPIALLARVPFVLVVNPALPVQSVDDLVRLAREKPGKITFGTPGPGTFHHLNAEMFRTRFGLDLVHVPYKGSAPALNDIVGGHIDMMFSDVAPALPLIEAGKLRPLGVTTAQRVPALARVPPLNEVGVPGFDTASWHTVTTTGGVPPAQGRSGSGWSARKRAAVSSSTSELSMSHSTARRAARVSRKGVPRRQQLRILLVQLVFEPAEDSPALDRT